MLHGTSVIAKIILKRTHIHTRDRITNDDRLQAVVMFRLTGSCKLKKK